MGQFIVKALICAVYCQKASICKHAVIQSQICLWRSALNQMASRLWQNGGGRKKRHRTKLSAYFFIYQSSNWWGIVLLYHLGSTPYCLYIPIIIACVLKSSVRALRFFSSEFYFRLLNCSVNDLSLMYWTWCGLWRLVVLRTWGPWNYWL